jgi:hypothetical protein
MIQFRGGHTGMIQHGSLRLEGRQDPRVGLRIAHGQKAGQGLEIILLRAGAVLRIVGNGDPLAHAPIGKGDIRGDRIR